MNAAFCFFFNRKKQVAVFLLNAGADVSLQAKNGCTAFDMASLIGEFGLPRRMFTYYWLKLASVILNEVHVWSISNKDGTGTPCEEDGKRLVYSNKSVWYIYICFVAFFCCWCLRWCFSAQINRVNGFEVKCVHFRLHCYRFVTDVGVQSTSL